MKAALLFACLMCLLCAPLRAQEWQIANYNKAASKDKRLLPRYGLLPRTPAEKASDSSFVAKIRNASIYKGDLGKAATELITMGYKCMDDTVWDKAMRLYNQAYLLEPNNPELFRAYSNFFLDFNDSSRAYQYVLIGMELNPNNPSLLNQAALIHFSNFSKGITPMAHLDTSLRYLHQSLDADPKRTITLYMLSLVYALKGDCTLAWHYYYSCRESDKHNLAEEYKSKIRHFCPAVKED